MPIAYDARRIYVGNLPEHVSESELIECFSSHDIPIHDIEIAQNGYGDGTSRGFAHVSCSTEMEANSSVNKLTGLRWSWKNSHRQSQYTRGRMNQGLNVQIAQTHWSIRRQQAREEETETLVSTKNELPIFSGELPQPGLTEYLPHMADDGEYLDANSVAENSTAQFDEDTVREAVSPLPLSSDATSSKIKKSKFSAKTGNLKPSGLSPGLEKLLQLKEQLARLKSK